MNRRAVWAVISVGLASALPLADVATGWGWYLESPAAVLACVAAGYAAGAWLRWPGAAVAVVVTAAAATVANQLDNDTYHWLDDLVFFGVVVGGPAGAGAAVTTRARQVRRLRRLRAELDERRRIDVAAARVEEQNRIQQEVHARLAERIGAIAVRAEGAQRSAADHDAMSAIETEARAVLDQLRGALGSLGSAVEPQAPVATARSRTTRCPTTLDVAIVLVIGVGLAIETNVVSHARGPAWLNVAGSLVMVAPLLYRRHWPIRAAAASCVAGLAMSAWLTPPPATVTGVAVMALIFYSVGAWSRRWWWVPGTLVALVGAVAMESVSGLASDGEEGDPAWIGLLFSLGAVALGRITAGWQERVRRIETVIAELERTGDAEVRLAIARERQTVASSLHDSVAHAMTVVCLQAGASRRAALAPGDALRTIAATAASSLAELREGLDAIESSEHPLEGARIAAIGRRTGVDVEVHAPAVRVTGPVAVLAFRVVREAIVNIARHAPGASSTVTLDTVGDEVRLEVVDVGGPAASFTGGSGTGLAGLAREVTAAGGSMEWGPHEGGGFRVVASLPLVARPVEVAG